jgi:hypothetical protein
MPAVLKGVHTSRVNGRAYIPAVLKAVLASSEKHRFKMIAHRRFRRTHTSQLYAPQKKILEGGTKEALRIFEALFKGVSTQLGARTIEKSFENPELFFCQSLQNLRLRG